MKIIFENDLILIKDTGHDYDFKYIIENKKNENIYMYLEGLDDYLEIEKNNWVGLFSGSYSDDIINCLKDEKYSYNLVYGV